MSKKIELDKAMGAVEAAQKAGVSVDVLRAALRKGELKGQLAHDRWFIQADDLGVWIKARQEAA